MAHNGTTYPTGTPVKFYWPQAKQTLHGETLKPPVKIQTPNGGWAWMYLVQVGEKRMAVAGGQLRRAK